MKQYYQNKSFLIDYLKHQLFDNKLLTNKPKKIKTTSLHDIKYSIQNTFPR